MDAARLARAVATAHRRRTEAVDGGRVVEVDGLWVQATGLPDPSVNFCSVIEEPADPAGALEAAAETLATIGMPFGLEIPVGRFPRLEEAVRERGLRRLFVRQVMTALVGELPALAPPWEAEVDRARTDDDLAALAAIDAEVFGVDLAVSRGLYGRGMADLSDATTLLARLDGRAAGGAFAIRVDETVGVFGVGVLPAARRRGLGGALTCAAARAVGMPDDVAWLFPTEHARPLYEALGFAPGASWEIWVD